jgi:hypothetical protein
LRLKEPPASRKDAGVLGFGGFLPPGKNALLGLWSQRQSLFFL